MKPLRTQTDGSSQTSASYLDVLDASKIDIVRRGLNVQAEFNTVCAFEYLKSYNIDSDVIQQVLLLGFDYAANNHP
jgi:hypothetical protein